MYEILAVGAILAGRIAGSLTDPINWALMGLVFFASIGIQRAFLTSAAITAIATVAHIAGMWTWWSKIGVANSTTVWSVISTKIVLALMAYGLGRIAKRLTATSRSRTQDQASQCPAGGHHSP